MIQARRETVVVVGTGMAGARVVADILARAPDRFAIRMLGEEPHGTYNRILLSSVLGGFADPAQLWLKPLEWFEEKKVSVHAGIRVEQIDRANQTVMGGNGKVVEPYDHLVLATGSRPFVPPIEGTRQQGVYVLFPAAQWGEKEWTSTSSERLVSFSPKLFDAPGVALPDWQILARMGKALGFRGFDYKNSAEVWDEFRRLTTGQPCDMTGITASRLRAERHVYWPCPTEEHRGSPRRYLDQVFPTPDGRARFLARPHQVPRELTDHEFPFILTTGRLYAHWHTLTRTAKCEKLNRRDPGAYLEIHPDDARKMDIANGEPVQISSRRGTIRLPARVSEQVAPGQVFLPFHWGDLYGQGNAVNYLTIAATDTISKQPELKFCAVAIEKIPAELTVGARTPTPAEVALVFAPALAATVALMEPVTQ